MSLSRSATCCAAVIFTTGFLASVGILRAQSLEPRAYAVSPQGTSFAVLGFARSFGDLSFDPSLPIEDAHATLNTLVAGYVYTLNVFGKSGNVGVQLPYTWGPASGIVDGQFVSIRRSGLSDLSTRFAVNLYGAPAMNLEEFAHYRQKTIIGTSVTFTAPVGQYDPNVLVNVGANRWSIKPELGISHGIGRWDLDTYLGVTFFTPNDNFANGHTRTQSPLGSIQVHVSYNITRRMWAAVDATYYTGGRSSIDGLLNADLQRNSRVGGTLAVPLTKRQSLKFSVSTGAVTNIGAAFTTVSVAYQRMWGKGF
jgi:hypothetical protein